MGDDGDSERSNGTGGGPRQDPSSDDETVPRVDLAIQNLSVSVTGRSNDDLETVEESARDLMAHLVAEANELEEDHDEYGLS